MGVTLGLCDKFDEEVGQSCGPKDPGSTLPISKRWNDMTFGEKADWVRAELQRMRSLFAMLASQAKEIQRAMKTIEKSMEAHSLSCIG